MFGAVAFQSHHCGKRRPGPYPFVPPPEAVIFIDAISYSVSIQVASVGPYRLLCCRTRYLDIPNGLAPRRHKKTAEHSFDGPSSNAYQKSISETMILFVVFAKLPAETIANLRIPSTPKVVMATRRLASPNSNGKGAQADTLQKGCQGCETGVHRPNKHNDCATWSTFSSQQWAH